MIIKPKPPKLDEWAIRAELRRQGWTFNRLARESGFAAKSFSAAFSKPSVKINTFMAKVLGVPVHELWPYWFDTDGDLIPARYRRKLSTRAPTGASHESKAA